MIKLGFRPWKAIPLATSKGIVNHSVRTMSHGVSRHAVMNTGSKNTLIPKAQDILDFWFGAGWEDFSPLEMKPSWMPMWFRTSSETDAALKEKFGDDCEALLQGQYDDWQTSGNVYNAVAGIILGDQFFRNVYRATPKMFAADPKALAWSKAIISNDSYSDLKPIMRTFVFLPLMHSENLVDQDLAMTLYDKEAKRMEAVDGGDEMARFFSMSKGFSERHRTIIARFGRFPHRNAILGRQSSPEEVQGLENGTIESF